MTERRRRKRNPADECHEEKCSRVHVVTLNIKGIEAKYCQICADKYRRMFKDERGPSIY